MTASTERFYAFLGEYDLAILGWLVADITKLLAKRRMDVGLHELGAIRLMRIVATDTVRFSEWLSLVSFDQAYVRSVVTIQAKCGSALGQMKGKLRIRSIAAAMSRMAGVAT